VNIFKLLPILTIILMLTNLLKAQSSGYKEVQLTNNAFDNRYASYNESGDRIIFESNRDGHWQIYSMDINGNDQKRLVISAANDRRPTWHPYKNIILFESDRSGTNELYILDLNKELLRKIPIQLNADKTFAQFAPNGKQVVFCVQEHPDNFNIYIVSHKGRRLKKVIDNSFGNLYPRYSPKGDNIVYFSNKNIQNKNDVIYVFNIITKSQSRLTYFKDHSFCPTWSNNGRRIAYVNSVKDNRPEIYIMRNDGSHKQRITFNENGDTLPNWSPKDINLLITGYRNGSYQICKILLKEPL